MIHRNFEPIAATTDPYSRSSATSKVRASERRECLSLRNGTALADGYRCDQLPPLLLRDGTTMTVNDDDRPYPRLDIRP